ncbi:histidine kinase [Piscinibacter sakaiensis]|uniref:sensor histidine kinase n=1 Tax=Piscinibacter sakaiensis TaxID=1547922 RepID=UPI003729C4DC
MLVLPSLGSLFVSADAEAWLSHLAPTQGLVDFGPLPALLATGAAVGGLLGVWLQLRHRAQAPAEVRARLVELQSRIRPHFLFNTLNSALGLVRRDPRRTEALLEDLAELFRAALADDGGVVTLADEIALARRYLAIEQIRFGERLQLHWDLDDAAAGARLPPLLLQPLVENAVRHGVEPDPAGGRISIRSRVHRGLAWVSVSNSLPAAGTARGPSTRGHGIALRNVRERLALMHDVAGRFEAGEADGRWRVQIGLPLPSAAGAPESRP